jgi:uncharacterized membrane protein YfcA
MMLFGVPLAELAWLALAVVAGGVATGILAGLFGVGGGAVIVPVLYEVFRVLDVPVELRMQLCVGTSLAIIVPTTILSYRVHRQRGVVMVDVLRAWWLPAVFGVAVGALAAAFAPAAVFRLAFVVIASFIGLKLLFARETWRLADDLPKGPLKSLYGFIVGLCSSLMGIGGGSVANVILTAYGRPLHAAVGTSAGLGVPITVAGAVGYALAGLQYQAVLPPLSIGFVSLIGLAVMAPVSSLVAPYGARLAHRTSKRRLEIFFGCFLLAMAVRFLVTLAW